MERDKEIASAMIRYYEERREAHDPDLEFLPFVVADPNAYLLGVIYNQAMSADHTWQIPQMLKGRLGHLDIAKIAEMDVSELEIMFGEKPALHRYWKTMALHTKRAATLLVGKYRADARNIWNDNPKVSVLYSRLLEFKGIGPKKANMAIRALALYFRVPIKNLSEIDIPVDAHIKRVFLRTGLSSSDFGEEIIEAARRVRPQFPAELDLPSWLIGRRWCHPTDPNCQNCVLTRSCRKIIGNDN